MSDIPEDIRKAAEKLLDDIDGYGYASRAEAVALALMAERERAAKIARTWRGSLAAIEAGRAIDAAIRRGDSPDA